MRHYLPHLSVIVYGLILRVVDLQDTHSRRIRNCATLKKPLFYRSVSTKTAVPKTTAQNAVLLKSLLLLAVLLLQSCAMSPPQRLQATAQSLGFEDAVVSAAGFDHRVFRNGNYESVVRAGRRGAVLHVYLEGDGTPWRMQHFITSDSTPRLSLIHI